MCAVLNSKFALMKVMKVGKWERCAVPQSSRSCYHCHRVTPEGAEPVMLPLSRKLCDSFGSCCTWVSDAREADYPNSSVTVLRYRIVLLETCATIAFNYDS